MQQVQSCLQSRGHAVVVLLAVAVALTAGAAGARLTETRLSTTPQAYPFTRLGSAVALADGLAIVGAPGANNGSQDAGAVYLFEQIGAAWLQTAMLVAEDGKRGDDFGAAVAGAVDTVAVLGDGEIYVFERAGEGWRQTAQLAGNAKTDSRAAPFETLAMAGSLLVAGATADRTGGRGAGALEVFERTEDGWRRRQRLVAPDAGRNRGFGYRVATDGRTIAGVDRTGALYLFHASASGWVPGDVAAVSPAAVTRLAVAGRWIVAVAGEPEAGPGESLLLIRRSRDRWKQVASLRADEFDTPDPTMAAIDSLDIDGRQVVVGQRGSGSGQSGARRNGVVHLLRRKGRRLQYERSLEGQSLPQEFDLPLAFGSAVSLERSLVLAGAPGIASAYVYVDR